MKSYLVVEDNNLNDLVAKVNNYLDNGDYIALGGISNYVKEVAHYLPGVGGKRIVKTIIFCQALVKE